MDYKKSYMEWLEDAYFDDETKKELKKIEKDDKEIQERFYKNLDFGTGGLRGIIGAGTNRINKYTVGKATQGLSNYILKQGEQGKNMGVAIAYDSRNMSPEFAQHAALVLNGNGIKTYLFESLRSTPELSFAVRHLGCIAGIVVTASHNPPEYNGYKVYWADGGQVPYPRDEAIITEVNAVENYSDVKVSEKEEAIKTGLFHTIDASVDDAFIKNVKAQSMNASVIDAVAESFKIVYTPLHGTGNKPVRRVLQEVGFKNVFVVPEQEMPDKNFSTVEYPNPEDPKAFTLAMKLATEKGADIVIGTDPDADRVGAVVKNSEGEYVILSGNMTGVLICDYILSQKKAAGTMPKDGAIISTIVSTDMTKAIAKAYEVELYTVLTGFKYIGEKIKQFEETKSNTFIFGFEESYGCLAGTYVRDKDAVVASMLICEMAAYYKTKDMSLYEGLQEIYKKYGFYKETIHSITLKGMEGVGKIKKIMNTLRTSSPVSVNTIKVVEVRDYQSSVTKNIITGLDEKIELPVSDVLYYVLEDNSWFCIRPSGTEPKIKVYFGVKGNTSEEADAMLTKLCEGTMAIINELAK